MQEKNLLCLNESEIQAAIKLEKYSSANFFDIAKPWTVFFIEMATIVTSFQL